MCVCVCVCMCVYIYIPIHTIIYPYISNTSAYKFYFIQFKIKM